MSLGRLVILGSGTSTGVPLVGKAYSPEFLAEPRNHRYRSSALISGPTGNLLVDCGPEMRLQLLRANVMDIEAVLITHGHADHVMGLDDLRQFSSKYKRPVPVYADAATQTVIRSVFPYMFREFPPGVEVPRVELIAVPDILRVGGLEIHTFAVNHGMTKVTGIRIGGVSYITDVKSIPEDAMPFVTGLDTLVIDAVRYKAHPNHLNFEEALELVARLGARQTYFTHLSDDYHHPEVDASLPPGVSLAYDGLVIPF